MKSCVTVLILGLLCAGAALAQITITESNWRGVGSVYTTNEADNVACPHGGPGGGQTWTVPSQTWQNITSEWWVAPASTPYGSSFPTATFAVTDSSLTGFTYLHISSSAVTVLGSGTMQADTPFVVIYPNSPVYMPLPATFNTSWTTVERISYEMAPGFMLSLVDSSTHLIDAWGTVVTPLAETYPALRSKDHEFQWAELNGTPTGPTDERYAYTWSGQDGRTGIRMKQVSGSSPDPNFVTGDLYVTRYMGTLAAEPPRGPVADHFAVGQNYPNPFNPTTVLPVELQRAGQVTMSIYDETGRLVQTQTATLSAGAHNLPIDGSNWATGTYFAQVRQGSQTSIQKMQLIK